MALEELKVFAAAVARFAAQGFSGTTFAQIEADLDLPAGTLAAEYGTLDTLWERSVLETFNQHHDVVYNRCAVVFASHAREIERLEQLIAIFIASAGDHPELQRIINHEATMESPRVDVIFAQAVMPLIQGFQPMIDSLVEAKEIRAIDDREMFFILANGAASVHAFTPLSIRFNDRSGPLDIEEYSRSLARLIVKGLRIHKPR
ncbi:MAG TPA: hypothetical protein VF426_08765 [Marmoricola sp.]